MSPDVIVKRVVVDRLGWVERMVATIRSLPLEDDEQFFADPRNVWTADACLRRALEALLDLGRHVLAKGFGQGTSEYKEIASGLEERSVLAPQEAALLRLMAGYRNRLVHFYHEVTPEELYSICSQQIGDVERVAGALRAWLAAHPERLDEQL